MAMYYFARKIQRARRPKSPLNQQQAASTSTSENPTLLPNGCMGNSNFSENKGSVAMTAAQLSSPSTSSSSNVENQQPLPSSSRTQFCTPEESELDMEGGTGAGLRTGSLDTLIRHLVPTETHYPDRAFTFAFLLASRLHVPPQEVLGRVLSLAFSPGRSNSSADLHRLPYDTLLLESPSTVTGAATALDFHTMANVIHLLGEWTELFPYDFRDERMMAHVRAITEKSVQMDSEPIREEVSHLLTTLLARLTGLERHEYLIHRLTTENALASPLTPPSILTICPNPAVLAQQLTHLELGRLAFVGPQEFVQDFLKESTTTPATTLPHEASFQMEPPNNSNPKASRDSMIIGPKKTRNLLSYLYWHTRLRYYVATEICRMPTMKVRAALIDYWIETARECFNIGNFNSLMAIIMSFNMAPVERLQKTWEKVDKTQLYFLHQQMNPANNYANYRFILQRSLLLESTVQTGVGGSVPEANAEERQRILVPFMSLFVKDVCFLSQECGAKLPNGQINFPKFWQLAKQVTEFMSWQQVQSVYPKVQPVMNALQMPPVLTERGLFLASYACENAISTVEQEHFQNLQESSADENLSNCSASASENPHSSNTSTSTK